MLILFAASVAAGAINAVAGGGTLLTFPALLAAGALSKIANATSTTALWPGQASSLWGLRREVREALRGRGAGVAQLLLIGVLGGGIGTWLFLHTTEKAFSRIVPFLILLSVVLFLVQEPLSRYRAERKKNNRNVLPDAPPAPNHKPEDSLTLTIPVAAFLLGIAVYGGYFGAGIGILTLAALGMVGMRDIHRMNGVKAVFTLGVNGVAAVGFTASSLVDWRVAGIMAAGSLFGGYAGADIARRLGQKTVRAVVVVTGVTLAAKLFWDMYSA